MKPYVVIVTCSDNAEQHVPLPNWFFNASFIKLSFQVRIVLLLMIEGVWDVTLCRVVKNYRTVLILRVKQGQGGFTFLDIPQDLNFRPWSFQIW